MSDMLLLEWRSDERLWAGSDGRAEPVQASLCFPWSDPGRHITLRDDDENEVALIPDLAELDDDSRAAVEKALTVASFVFEISRVLSTREDFEIRQWKVETRQGARTFQTKLDDWPHPLPGGGWMLRDVAGDLYYIRDLNALDAASRKEVWAFVG